MKTEKKSEKMNTFKKLCRMHGLRITPQRTIIYKELIRAKNHPSVEMLYKKVRKSFPNISFDTVYRTAISFAEIGLVRVVEGWGDPKRFDSNISPHHHFRCIKCNKIVDFNYVPFDELAVPEQLRRRFVITRKRVILEGLCEQCRNRKDKEGRK